MRSRPPALPGAKRGANGSEDWSCLTRRPCADAVIAFYGTIRDYREAFGGARPILKLDLTTVAVGGHYPVSEYVLAWSLDHARRLEVDTVLSYVQLGTPFELNALRDAARIAAACDAAGFTYICEIMPAGSEVPESGDDAVH